MWTPLRINMSTWLIFSIEAYKILCLNWCSSASLATQVNSLSVATWRFCHVHGLLTRWCTMQCSQNVPVLYLVVWLEWIHGHACFLSTTSADLYRYATSKHIQRFFTTRRLMCEITMHVLAPFWSKHRNKKHQRRVARTCLDRTTSMFMKHLHLSSLCNDGIHHRLLTHISPIGMKFE